MSPHGVMSHKKASHNPGLSPIKGQKFGLGTQTRSHQFLLLAYWLDSSGFLEDVTPDVVRTMPLCGNLQNMFFFNAQFHFTITALHKHFVSHPWPYT